MGVLNILLRSAIDAIEEVGKGNDYQNDGYHFKADTTTRSVDDITIKADSNEFVLACVWKNLPDYKPSLPNLKHAFDNYGWTVRDKVEITKIISDLMYYASNNPNAADACKAAEAFLDNL